jgi:hypothetical protein
MLNVSTGSPVFLLSALDPGDGKPLGLARTVIRSDHFRFSIVLHPEVAETDSRRGKSEHARRQRSGQVRSRVGLMADSGFVDYGPTYVSPVPLDRESLALLIVDRTSTRTVTVPWLAARRSRLRGDPRGGSEGHVTGRGEGAHPQVVRGGNFSPVVCRHRLFQTMPNQDLRPGAHSDA